MLRFTWCLPADARMIGQTTCSAAPAVSTGADQGLECALGRFE
jgi:hypothetical protein